MRSLSSLNEKIILAHRYGQIILVDESIYRVRLFIDPDKKIYTTSLDQALHILNEIADKEFCQEIDNTRANLYLIGKLDCSS